MSSRTFQDVAAASHIQRGDLRCQLTSRTYATSIFARPCIFSALGKTELVYRRQRPRRPRSPMHDSAGASQSEAPASLLAAFVGC